MKKVLIGAGVLLLVVILLVGIGGYKLFKMGQGFVQEMEQVREIYAGLDQDFPFTAPQDDQVTEEAYGRWIVARTALSNGVTSMHESIDALENDNSAGFKEVFGMFSHFVDIAEAHGAGLREAQMSRTEYNWISARIIAVLDSTAKPDLSESAAELVDAYEKEMNALDLEGQPNDFRQSLPRLQAEDAEAILALLVRQKESFLATGKALMGDVMLLSFDGSDM